jgi:hypothetical protein
MRPVGKRWSLAAAGLSLLAIASLVAVSGPLGRPFTRGASTLSGAHPLGPTRQAPGTQPTRTPLAPYVVIAALLLLVASFLPSRATRPGRRRVDQRGTKESGPSLVLDRRSPLTSVAPRDPDKST